MGVRIRYSRWDGTQDPFGPDLSAGDLLDSMSQEILSGAGADSALSRLLRRGDDGRWHVAALLDPACKYAHCEAELSYMEQFHTVTPAFLRTYQQSQRLAPEYHRVRKPVYQLYEMLNHLYVFGPEYLKPTLAAVERVSPLV